MATFPPDVLDTLLATRHSCRAFVPDPVPPSTLESILRSAQRTSSWCNSQAWQVAIASGAATERLRTALVDAVTADHTGGSDFPFPAEYTGVYLERRRESF